MLLLTLKVEHIIKVFLWMGINYPFKLQDFYDALMLSSYEKKKKKLCNTIEILLSSTLFLFFLKKNKQLSLLFILDSLSFPFIYKHTHIYKREEKNHI